MYFLRGKKLNFMNTAVSYLVEPRLFSASEIDRHGKDRDDGRNFNSDNALVHLFSSKILTIQW